MSSRCTCCHICHTSSKTCKTRKFVGCTTCTSVICNLCIESPQLNQSFDEIDPTTYECPRCLHMCPCKRCKPRGGGPARRSNGFTPTTFKGAASISGVAVSPLAPRRSVKRARSISPTNERHVLTNVHRKRLCSLSDSLVRRRKKSKVPVRALRSTVVTKQPIIRMNDLVDDVDALEDFFEKFSKTSRQSSSSNVAGAVLGTPAMHHSPQSNLLLSPPSVRSSPNHGSDDEPSGGTKLSPNTNLDQLSLPSSPSAQQPGSNNVGPSLDQKDVDVTQIKTEALETMCGATEKCERLAKEAKNLLEMVHEEQSNIKATIHFMEQSQIVN